jgi:transcriptional regulator with XRE-family HTH domain
MAEMSEDVEVRRALKLLEALIKAHGLTKKALDQKLSKGPGYISQVLTGRLELKYRHILEILGALELDPGLFFRALFLEPEKPSDSGRVMEKFLESLQKMGYYGELLAPSRAEHGPGRAAPGFAGAALPTAGAAAPATPAPAAAGAAGDPAAGDPGAPARGLPGIDPDDLDRRIRSAVREALAERGDSASDSGGGEPRPPRRTASS